MGGISAQWSVGPSQSIIYDLKEPYSIHVFKQGSLTSEVSHIGYNPGVIDEDTDIELLELENDMLLLLLLLLEDTTTLFK